MTVEDLQKRFSQNLKKERKLAGLTQEKLAEKADLSFQMINDIEGCRRWPSEKSLTKIANALMIDVQELFKAEFDSLEKDLEIPLYARRIVAEEVYSLFGETIKQYLNENREK